MEPQTGETFKDVFGQYLSRKAWDWTWVVHQTFGDLKTKIYPKIVEHSWRHFMHTVAREAVMNYGFCFAEKGATGRLHWHALVHVKKDLFGLPRMTDVWEDMFIKYGRNKLELYNCPGEAANMSYGDGITRGIAAYCTKYVAKDTWSDDAWWDFDGFMGGSKVDCQRIRDAIGLDLEGLR